MAETVTYPPGEHVWCVFDDDRSFTSVVASYFADGVAQGQRLIWLSRSGNESGLADALDGLDLAFSDLVDRGQLLVRRNRPIGSFDVDAAMDGWVRRADQARADGYHSLRVASEVPVPEDGPVDEGDLLAYEFEADSALARSGSVALCGYDLRRWDLDSVEIAEPFHGTRLSCGPSAGGAPFSLRARCGGAAVSGEVDHFDAPLLARSLTAATRMGRNVVVDLSGLDFVGAAGLGQIACAVRAWVDEGREVTLQNASPVFRRCWSVLGYDATVPAVFN